MNRVRTASPPVTGTDDPPGGAARVPSAPSGIRVEGLDLQSPRPAERYGAPVLGLSPFNSFYSTQTVTALRQSAAESFSDVHVVLPGGAGISWMSRTRKAP
ncbi:hypothetical protein EES43_13610 [Streptomyces sp. ADI96-02]|uniref:hypothetical protein n=1 Tax=Streptomyces sp. ADI96-02 TaxID=1522760 RepID=UPI000F54FF26|nr:hypothetical protein [Streptomyces sp. ADI96-02]RPK62588.1 hypothetical protein EES43_13610 [Streptomyces sp. ADI96-02]